MEQPTLLGIIPEMPPIATDRYQKNITFDEPPSQCGMMTSMQEENYVTQMS